MDDTILDGNAAAGLLGEVFAGDMTVAVTSCAGCGSTHPVGELRAYLQAPGLVLRCGSCGTVQLRMVRTAERAWLDFSGVRWLRVEFPPDERVRP